VRKPDTERPAASADLGSSSTSVTTGRSWSPWRAVVGFGVVSLAADMVYEGARSVTGPLLASLGASAVLVGLVSGAGEAMALLLRVVFGSWADRSGRYWRLTFVGYALTAICVPALAITPFLAGAGLTVACILILGERFGKAVRSPAKTALLAHAAADVGLGRGFGVHKALDQIGAVAGPVLVAAVVAVAGSIPPAMAVLIVPGALAMLVLARIRRNMGDPFESRDMTSRTSGTHEPDRPEPRPSTSPGRLPQVFWLFAAASAAISGGLVTFAVIAYHLTQDQVVPVAAVPLIYAAAMGAAALAALGSGWLFDRTRGGALLGLPFLVSAVPALAFTGSPPIAMAGVLVWGLAGGVLESTIKALVADLVPAPRLATAYGVFAAVQGAAAIVGGVMAGALYERSLPALIVAVAATQVVALVLLIATLRRNRRNQTQTGSSARRLDPV
jgi:MFS family permease